MTPPTEQKDPPEKQTPTGWEPHSASGSALAEVSRAMVAIHKRHLGKGPVRARATIAKDVLTVILEGGFTRAEETLKNHGAIREVAEARSAMQDALEHDFRVAVETILYRSVRSFMSASDPERELQAEIFVLDPAEEAEPHEPELKADVSAHLQLLGDRARRARDENREILDEHRALRAEQHQTRTSLDRH